MIPLRPSHSYRWSNCAAAPTFEAGSPIEPDSDAAREGTCAAALADACLRGNFDAINMLGTTHANGWLITSDMCQHVQSYVALIRSRGGITTTEQFVRLNEFIAGTLDASTALDSVGVLHVTDLKYGFRIVEVFELPQLIIYGAAECLRQWKLGVRIDTVSLEIYQPRAFHPDGILRAWVIPVTELFIYANDLIFKGEQCQKSQPIATPGRHCRDCRATTSCVAFIHSIYTAVERIESWRQKHRTADELAKDLNVLEYAESLIKTARASLETEAISRMGKGEHIAGWHVKERYGNRRFRYDPAVIQGLTGVSAFEKPKAVTPAELERRGANVDVVALLTDTPSIGRSLQSMPENYIRKAFEK